MPRERVDWAQLGEELDARGYARIRKLATEPECEALVDAFRQAATFLPDEPLEALRANLYAGLVATANRWSAQLGEGVLYPADFQTFRVGCREAGPTREQSAIRLLDEGDYEPLHWNADGSRVFPLQVAVLLSQPGRDFSGGEFVTTEQRPRMQSRPSVLAPQQGDAIVFAVQRKPFRGSTGVYRVNLRHGVSRVRSGQRLALELLLHG